MVRRGNAWNRQFLIYAEHLPSPLLLLFFPAVEVDYTASILSENATDKRTFHLDQVTLNVEDISSSLLTRKCKAIKAGELESLVRHLGSLHSVTLGLKQPLTYRNSTSFFGSSRFVGGK